MNSTRTEKQQGVVAIEFAAIFLLFFSLVYATIAFGFPAVTRMGLQHYAVEAGRAAMKVDPHYGDQSSVLERVGHEIERTINAGWVPPQWRNQCALPNDSSEWSLLPNTDYGYWRLEPNTPLNRIARYQFYICIQADTPIVPPLRLSSELVFPPQLDANGNPWVRGYTITTL
ncbi:TadE/TadG family type IV pilus assembly protein [Halomonas dongshanensis]|uniref:Pilus assembly protein n=1 Tax=Halomonas dongshanensis TaxID=2890835 RepID=A0ABT2EH36_9GAMM|nr:pilus assembly protein [Halomonas dongshanensis]